MLSSGLIILVNKKNHTVEGLMDLISCHARLCENKMTPYVVWDQVYCSG